MNTTALILVLMEKLLTIPRTRVLVFTGNARSIIPSTSHSSSFQNLNKGVGDLARALKVEGKPGNYNILQYLVPDFIGQLVHAGSRALMMSARDRQEPQGLWLQNQSRSRYLAQ